MDEKDKKAKQKKDEAAVQAELEQQLRDLGVGVNELKDTVNDAFRHGFEGRGDELGRQVNDVASDVTAVLNSVVGEVADAFQQAMDLKGSREERREREHRRWQQREARRRARRQEDGGAYDYAGRWQTGPGRVSWGRYRSDWAAPEGDYVKSIRWSARKRFGIGLALAVTCGIFAFSFFVGGIACFVSTEAAVVSTIPIAETALAWTGIGLMVGGGLCTVGAVSGGEQLEASQLLNRCAAAFEGLDLSEGVDLDDLAGLLQVKKRKLRKQLRELINKGWLTGWLDERGNCLYLSAADYRAAHNIPPQPAPEPKAQPQPEPEAGAAPDKTVLHLETAQRFAHVLAEERKLMADPAAADELGKMQKTTESICAWLESHPESAPKARRFAEYYIPTTLKLLHTYNDVQGQQGDNAEAIRRDIGGILHTLNTAYANLYDTLLGDAALDVSSEIAALEGMLASDGLTGEGFSTGEGAR